MYIPICNSFTRPIVNNIAVLFYHKFTRCIKILSLTYYHCSCQAAITGAIIFSLIK